MHSRRSFLTIVAIAAMLATMLGAMVPAPASAAEQVILSAAQGPVGKVITAKLKGFAPGSTKAVSFDGVVVKNVSIGSTGVGTGKFPVPAKPAGVYAVTAGAGSANFTVLPKLAFNGYTGAVGTPINVTATGFAASDTVAVMWDGTTNVEDVATDTSGSGTGNFVVPASVSGAHNVTGDDGVNTDTVVFTVVANVSLSANDGHVGDSITATFTGYGNGETISVNWDGVQISTVGASSVGSASTSVTIPATTFGNHKLAGVGAISQDRAIFAVLPTITSDVATGDAGDTVNVALTGFGASESVAIKLGSNGVKNVNTSANGSATTSFLVPAITPGAYPLRATGVTTRATDSTPFTVTGVTANCVSSPASGPVGTVITVACTGYKTNELVTVYWEVNGGTPRASDAADLNGEAVVNLTVPSDTAGAHALVAKGGTTGQIVNGGFTIESSVKMRDLTTPVGSINVIQLRGFAANTVYHLNYDGVDIAGTAGDVTTDANGSANKNVTVPAGVKGVHTVSVELGATDLDATFSVIPSLEVPSSRLVGASTTMLGHGFASGETVTFSWSPTGTATIVNLGTATADSSGEVELTLNLPAGVGGAHVITATGNGATPNTATDNLTVLDVATMDKLTYQSGTTAVLTMTGFDGSTAVSFTYTYTGGTPSPALNLSATTNSVGSATISFTVPSGVTNIEIVVSTSGVHSDDPSFGVFP